LDKFLLIRPQFDIIHISKSRIKKSVLKTNNNYYFLAAGFFLGADFFLGAGFFLGADFFLGAGFFLGAFFFAIILPFPLFSFFF